MTIKNTVLRRLTAGAGALALAMAGAVAMGTAASAAPAPGQEGAPTSGTLTINKYSGAHTENPSEENLLDGVEFTVTQVGRADGLNCVPLNLTNADDWDGLAGLFDSAPAVPAAPFCLTDVTQVKATDAGQAVFTLPVGIYFVKETGSGANPIVSPVPNFYVSIPTSVEGAAGGWNYSVVVNPKNQLMGGPSKTIADQTDFVVGADVTWTISVPIPTLNNDDTFDTALVTDVLDSRLTYKSSTVAIDGTTIGPANYDVTGNTVWTFNAAGRALLYDAQGKNVTITLVTTVNSVGDGTIPNDVYSSSFNGANVPGVPVPYTYWGQLSIMKVDDSAAALALKGAEFQVFVPIEGVCAETAPASGAIATGTSDASGVVKWVDGAATTDVLGLWIANSNEPLTAPSNSYCVYETGVPAGHTAVPFENKVTISAGTITSPNLTVTNAKTEGPDLPLTGAQGTLMMTIGGLLLVGVGTGAIVVSRRRNAQA